VSAGTGKKGLAAALKNSIVAALENPLALLDARSPGGRPPGSQHLTKTTSLPHERVLSEVREHPAPGVDGPAIAEDEPVVSDALPDISGQSGDSPASPPINAPFENPGYFFSSPGDTGSPPGNPATPGAPGGSTPGDPGNPSGTPPNDPGTPGGPPGDPGSPPPGGGTPPIAIPEPAGWSLMLFSLLVVATIRPRRQRRAVV
jgi:hypothetical protein